MATGRVSSLKKDYGFIKDDNGADWFFHRAEFYGHWVDLQHDFDAKINIPVTFDESEGAKGPRAANVRRTDFPNQA